MNLEKSIIYSLTGLAILVSWLVYGATLLRSSGGLFASLRSVFGVGYGVLAGALLVGLLIHNQRWKGLMALAATYAFFLYLSFAPWKPTSFEWDEYLVISLASSGLFLSSLSHYDNLE